MSLFSMSDSDGFIINASDEDKRLQEWLNLDQAGEAIGLMTTSPRQPATHEDHSSVIIFCSV